MASPQATPPPRKKESGLIGSVFSSLVQGVFWLAVSLMLSILIEWVGMIWFWPGQGSEHAKAILTSDQVYLNQALYEQPRVIKRRVIAVTHQSISWIVRQSWIKTIVHAVPNTTVGYFPLFQDRVQAVYQRHRDYLQASTYVTQTFAVRLALIVFSLPIFLIAALVGGVDGLVERDLRRWGGGRESSHVFNLARRSIMPAFVAACVIYISVPFSINPTIIILPFAILHGLAVRITFERLKKYF